MSLDATYRQMMISGMAWNKVYATYPQMSICSIHLSFCDISANEMWIRQGVSVAPNLNCCPHCISCIFSFLPMFFGSFDIT